jgi:peptidyl-Lys metalloendopeptidase
MRSAGQYQVRARGEFSQAFIEGSRDGMKSAFEFRANTPTSIVWIDGAHVAAEPDLSWLVGAKAGSVSFVGCSNTRASSITTAVGSSKTYAANSKSYLGAGTVGARYTTWFGTYSSTRYSTVRTHFNNIDSALNNQALVFDCSCTDSAYAYVYPTQPYKIYLCNAFWSAPNTGTDSRAGTIIHEMSHFNVVAGTDDHAYGQTAAKRLATRTPNKAVDNADNHEYFAENTPFQN